MASLEESINQAALAKISSYERYLRRLRDENNRRARRSTSAPTRLEAQLPTLWQLDDSFNPFHVRSRRRAIAHSILGRLDDATYEPRRPGGFLIPKDQGQSRLVTAFPIADEVVSRRLYRSLMRKNQSRLSGHSYAYRDDRSVHDAIAHIQSEWRGERRLFVAQYDFSAYFESLRHAFIMDAMSGLGLMMTSLEKLLLSHFMQAPRPYTSLAEKAENALKRDRGVHQGTSVSLFLANVALTPLDRDIERLGASFARYADDVLIWGHDYGSVCRAVELLHVHAERTGCGVNQVKSRGIELLVASERDPAEMAKTNQVTYLSHSLKLGAVMLAPKAVVRFKKRISALLFNHLLREPLKGTQQITRLSALNDNDYIAFIWQLRRYLYGNLSESDVRRLQSGPVPAMRLSGAVSRFPLIDSYAQLRDLDQWISTQAWLALRRREQLLGGVILVRPRPWGRSREELFGFITTSTKSKATIDARLPSLVRMATVVARAVRSHGTGVVGQGHGLYGHKQ